MKVKAGTVPEGNRKDVRNAVEAAYGAKGGWGKRAAFNRAQVSLNELIIANEIG